MFIISWNVAGIKKRRAEIVDLVQTHQPDILCVQKTRCKEAPTIKGYNCICECADQWSGVATYCLEGLEYSFIESDSHHLILEFDSFVLINAYVPYSNKSVPGFIERRKEWDKWIIDYVKSLSKPVIMCGDLNIVHTALDTFQAKYEQNTGCYYAWERENFNRLIEEGNMFDTFRFKYPDKQGYTYFDTMHGTNYRALNLGTRLDYFLLSKFLKPYLVKSDILSGFGSAPSVPILLEINYPERVYTESDSMKELKESLDRFTRQYLQNDIDNFLNFNLVDLKSDKEFGCPGRFFAPDDYTQDHRFGCDELAAIRDSLAARGIPTDKIILDYEGTRTIHSVYKFAQIIDLDSATFISQKVHNERAIFLAKWKENTWQIVAYNAKPSHIRRNRIKNTLREYMARVKMFVDIITFTTPSYEEYSK